MSSPNAGVCVTCHCCPCICVPGCISPIPGTSFAPNYLCVTCWSTPCVCSTSGVDPQVGGDPSPGGPFIYCAICYKHPCVCPLNQHWFCSECGHNLCTCRMECGCMKGIGCGCTEEKKCDCEDEYECCFCCPPEKFDEFPPFVRKSLDNYSHRDMWMHRSDNMHCGYCMWWVEKVGDYQREPGEQRLGRCRKHAPTLNGWPAVYDMDWCGDHKMDENKLR